MEMFYNGRILACMSDVFPLDVQIDDYCKQRRPKELHRNLKQSVENKTVELLRWIFNDNLHIQTVGSTANDLDVCTTIHDSDLDISVLTNRGRPKDLHIIKEELKKSEFASNVSWVPQISSVRFKDTVTGICTDIIINNETTMKSTYLVRHYLAVSPILKDLLVIIKLWAQYQRITDATKRGLHSYGLTLMAIFYLQVKGVLPCLHKEKPDLFGEKSNYMNLQHVQLANADKSPNHDESLSIDTLFIEFLEYYIDKFDFNKEGISVRLGRTIRKPESTARRNHRIFIEDPFNQTNVAKAVKCDDSFKKIMHAFTQSLTRLEISDDLSEVVGQYMAWDIENDEWVNLD